MRIRILSVLWALLAISATGAVAARAQGLAKPEKPAAVVNGEPIPQADLRALIDARQFSPVALSAQQQKELKQSALDMLVDDMLMRQFLRKQVKPPSAAEVGKEMDELKEALKKQNKSLDQFLRDSKQTEDQLHKDIVARLQWKGYLTARFPDDAQLKSYYEANKPFFDKVFVRASHILVKVSSNATAAEKQTARSKLETLRQEILAGKIKFDDAARKYSDCPSKDKGGDIGAFPFKFVVVEPFARAAFSSKKNEISEVVTTDFGFHLIMTTDRTAGEASHFEALRDTIREVIAQEMDLYHHVIAEQRKAAKIDVN
ncbi:MAG: peptidylprolyl isomerase [Planctomycetes bacterium]|nr:peptidylprolyl isomerase [Planctomycetota bacterium]